MSMNMDTPFRWAGAAPTTGAQAAAPTTGEQATAASPTGVQAPLTMPTFMTPSQREARKAEIRKRLAEIDAQLARHNQYSVAAKAARIGDMTPYMQILSQQQNASATSRAATQGIENELYNAAKAIPILDGTDEERRAAMGTIQVALEKADAKNDPAIKELKIYKELKSALGAPRGATVTAKINEFENRMWNELQKNGYVEDDTHKELVDYLASEEGSDKTGRGQQVADRYKGLTKAAKAKVAAKKAQAKAEYDAWPVMTPLEANIKWAELADAGHPITEYYELRAGMAKPTKRTK